MLVKCILKKKNFDKYTIAKRNIKKVMTTART